MNVVAASETQIVVLHDIPYYHSPEQQHITIYKCSIQEKLRIGVMYFDFPKGFRYHKGGTVFSGLRIQSGTGIYPCTFGHLNNFWSQFLQLIRYNVFTQ